MASRRSPAPARRKPRVRARRRRRLLPTVTTRRRAAKRWRSLPAGLRAALLMVALTLGWLLVNWGYHVARKPTELLFPVSDMFYKTPAGTWEEYGALFRAHSTAVITPELLAALAQVEASGNPIARTYWRWSASLDAFAIWRPASSAVGMFQFTDTTFEEARRYCVHDHVVVEQGAWNDPRSCWFNSLYTRVLPTHAVELTSAYLDRRVADILARNRLDNVSLARRRELATLIHLCGAGAGNAYARRGLRLRPGERCGDHDAREYLDRVERMRVVFARLAAQS